LSSSSRASRRRLLPALLAAAAELSSFAPGAASAAGPEERAGDPDLARAIAQAIERGQEALLRRFEAQLWTPPQDYPMGYIALSLAALLKSGLAADHPLATRAFKKLAAMKPAETYSVACYLMALDAWIARLPPARAAPAGTTSVGPSRSPGDAAARTRMQELVAWLAAGSGGTWTYMGRGDGDLSNTQFAVLGLEVALENDVPVPAEVFRAVAEHLCEFQVLSTQTKTFDLKYTFPGWGGAVAPSTRAIERRARLGGWNYEFHRTYQPSFSMTAAGVSSLLIARRGLRRAGAHDPALAARVEAALAGGLGWMAKHLRGYTESHYALYSLEKGMDIGAIILLDRVDWYAFGARHLVSTQRPDGSWRSDRGEAADTALALLFLTRATRVRLHAHGPPIFITRGEESSHPGGAEIADRARAAEESDLVYIDQVGGFVSATALFEFFAESRQEQLFPIVARAIARFPPHRTGECLEKLLLVWTAESDAASRFARVQAEELAGLKGGSRAALERAGRGLCRVRELEAAPDADPAAVEALFAAAEGTALKLRLIDLVDRHGLAGLFERLIGALSDGEEAVRRRAEEALERWTQAGIVPRGAAERAARSPEETATRWRNWWNVHGKDYLARHSFRRLAERIAREKDPERLETAIIEAEAAGPGVVPHLVEALERGEYTIHLVRALERVTGVHAGLRAADWKEALAATR
jgi:hypothetical protein